MLPEIAAKNAFYQVNYTCLVEIKIGKPDNGICIVIQDNSDRDGKVKIVERYRRNP